MTNYNHQLDLLYQYLCGWIDNKWYNIERTLSFEQWQKCTEQQTQLCRLQGQYTEQDFKNIMLNSPQIKN